MGVVGFDISSNRCGVAIVPNDKVTYQDVKNKENHKETPSVICFDGKQRLIGTLAASKKNSFSQVMDVIGKTELDLKSELGLSCLLKKGSDDLLLFRVSDLKGELCFTATQLLAMVISELKATAERELKVDNIEECCIGIPGYFSDLQRAAVCQAAEVAGLHNVSLLEATTAIALGHGVIRRGIHQWNKEYNIAILDVASSIMQVSIVRFKSKTLDVLSFAYDASIGEKSSVDVLVNHFKNSADSVDLSLLEVRGNLKELSKQGMKVELRSGGKQISRSKFKGICEHIWNRMKVLLEEAMAQAAIGKEKVHGVLVSGSGAAIYGIKELLEEFFPRQSEGAEKHVFVAADSVAKGCAIQCAITSEEFKAREDNVRYKGTKESLLKFTVSDKWPCVKDKTTEVQVAQATYGRFILTPQEITDARESERKMAVREKVRVKVSDILKVKDFAKKEEIMELNKVNCQLDKDDLNEEFLYLALLCPFYPTMQYTACQSVCQLGYRKLAISICKFYAGGEEHFGSEVRARE